MLEARTGSRGIRYYVSPIFEVMKIPHAFSTRVGGVSAKPFDSLNLGIARDAELKDSVENIEENYRRLAEAIGCENRRRCWVSQVHGADCCEIVPGDDFTSGPRADAMICNDGGRILSIKYADCVPILVASEDGRAVAAIHAGWRGLVAGVIAAAIARMAKISGLPASGFVAAIGPCISKAAFEVGPEVLTSFDRLLDERSLKTYTCKGHVDLKQETIGQLKAAGVAESRIDQTDLCTFETRGEFYSHRRDGAATGRMAALVGPVR
jgi:YfiH family protein